MFKMLLFVAIAATPPPPTASIVIIRESGAMKICAPINGKPVKILASGAIVIGDDYNP